MYSGWSHRRGEEGNGARLAGACPRHALLKLPCCDRELVGHSVDAEVAAPSTDWIAVTYQVESACTLIVVLRGVAAGRSK